jgi:hypothetical protein
MVYTSQIADPLGDPTRRLTFKGLRSGAIGGRDRCGDGRESSCSFPALSILKAVLLVTDRAEGTRRLYAVDQRGIESFRTVREGNSGRGSKPD